MKKHTILFVFHVPFIPQNGGVERVTHILTNAFIAKGHTVYYLSSKKRETDFQCPVKQFYFPSSDYNSKENVDFYQVFLKKNKIDIVVNQNGAEKAAYLYLNVNYRERLKIISVVHINPLLGYRYYQYSIVPLWVDASWREGLVFLIKLVSFPLRYMFYKINTWYKLKKQYGFVASRSDLVLLLSENYIPQMSSVCPQATAKLKSIPNPIQAVSHPGFCKKKQLLYVGRFDMMQKRVDRLVKIWKKIYRQHFDWELILVGYGEGEKYLRAYVKRHHLERVVFAGQCNPSSYYQTASILCLTSCYEGLPMVILEAMQNKVIPVAFDSFAAASDLIIQGKTGRLVTPFDLEEYARTLDELMLDSFDRNEMAMQAFHHVRNFTVGPIIAQWEVVFDQITRE